MPLQAYGVLKGRLVAHQRATDGDSHIHLLVSAGDALYRASVNVRSRYGPSCLEYAVDEQFRHLVLAQAARFPVGFTRLPRRPGGGALDYIRGGFVTPAAMHPLPFDQPGPDNDLNDVFARYVLRALADPQAIVYAFGERWGPDHRKADEVFGFKPAQGIHNIHMNQASRGRFRAADGSWQDGAMLFHLPGAGQWIAVWLKFQSQGWRSHPRTGRRLPDRARRRLCATTAHGSGAESAGLVAAGSWRGR